MLVHAHGFAVNRGLAEHVDVELDARPGLPSFSVIGLGSGAARDGRERVQAAVLNSGFAFPRRRVTVNLAPAAAGVSGPAFDLALACCVLAAEGGIDGRRLARIGLFAQLGLGGDLRRLRLGERRRRGRRGSRPRRPDRRPRGSAGGPQRVVGTRRRPGEFCARSHRFWRASAPRRSAARKATARASGSRAQRKDVPRSARRDGEPREGPPRSPRRCRTVVSRRAPATGQRAGLGRSATERSLAQHAQPSNDRTAAVIAGSTERCFGACCVCDNRSVRLLRMKPGHGEVLVAEGDVEVAEEERELIEAFRAQLELRGCGPRCRCWHRTVAVRQRWSEIGRCTARRRPRDLFPARGRGLLRRQTVLPGSGCAGWSAACSGLDVVAPRSAPCASARLRRADGAPARRRTSRATTPGGNGARSSAPANCCARASTRTTGRCTAISGSCASGARAAAAAQTIARAPSYAYLIYPHKPIVAYVPQSSRLLSEYCVEFPDRERPFGSSRLPASDDVLAKWMALTADERALIENANLHLAGRQRSTRTPSTRRHRRRSAALGRANAGGAAIAAVSSVVGVVRTASTPSVLTSSTGAGC